MTFSDAFFSWRFKELSLFCLRFYTDGLYVEAIKWQSIKLKILNFVLLDHSQFENCVAPDQLASFAQGHNAVKPVRFKSATP